MKLIASIYRTPARYRKWRGYGFRRMDSLAMALKYRDF
jgi:hypothetical protein